MNLLERRSNADKQATEVIAQKLRIQRVELFSRLSQAEHALRVLFNPIADDLSTYVEKHATNGGMKAINERIRENMVILRRMLNAWLMSAVRDSARMSLRHANNALLPIFQYNQEMLRMLNVGVILAEAKLSFDISTKFANRTDPRVKIASDKWSKKQTVIVRKVAKGVILTTGGKSIAPSQLIWDLSRRTELDLRRLVSSGIAAGEGPATIARKVKKYVSPARTDYGTFERGVYRSPFKNAMRLARTEALRAYNHMSAEFAKDKPWLIGMQVTLSPRHEVEDECDDYAGDVISPDEFKEKYPLHPHCMCYGAYVIDPKYLGKE